MSSYKIEEVDAAVRNLNDLLDVMCELQFALGKDEIDRRINSLLWIARDISEGIVAFQDKQGEENIAKFKEKRQ
ncbi:hypothetical protein M0654_03560 [Rhizobium sp. NTR19]|uniref:NTP pyrophosphohydrolase MazG putative catalytic core domain-containing protein n=1 Tax=Neorhizobium turbinariae TaxID=2937795 RepID=A0ABT0IMF8_9HYPH|nr:hypothetical protein [Neorhizobium turbinariae]MCK8779056.1 hypothetical protein [Neorhizobium turbinariae]